MIGAWQFIALFFVYETFNNEKLLQTPENSGEVLKTLSVLLSIYLTLLTGPS